MASKEAKQKRYSRAWYSIKDFFRYWLERLIGPVANWLYEWASDNMMKWVVVGDLWFARKPKGEETDKIVIKELHGKPYYQVHFLDMSGSVHKVDVGHIYENYNPE